MLKLIKSPSPAPDVAAPRRKWLLPSPGRLIYLILLAGLGLGLLHYLLGSFVIFRADGLVIRDHIAVATTYLARVTEVDVREGQPVKTGDVLFRLESTDMLERLADLSARRAELRVRLLDMQARLETAETLLPLADTHEKRAAHVLGGLARISGAGLVTSARFEQALRDNYEASEIRVRLGSDYKVIRSNVEEFGAALRAAAETEADLQAHYAQGIVRAPVTGPVGARVPSVGDVVRPGDICLSVYSGEAYVLAYLPTGYLFPMRVGMTVDVASGRRRTRGVISEILPLSDALPQEFQNTFQPQDRKQLAKIRLSDGGIFPIGEKVRLTRAPFWEAAPRLPD